MREDLVAAVEILIERKVIAFMSDNHIDPDMAAEIFILEPEDDVEGLQPARDGGLNCCACGRHNSCRIDQREYAVESRFPSGPASRHHFRRTR